MELLGGRTVPLTYAYMNSPAQQRIAAYLQENLRKAGFEVTLQAVDADKWYTVLGRKDNPFDFYMVGWGSDWPSGATVIPPLLDGRTITPTGNLNLSYLDMPDMNARMDAIARVTNLAAAAAEWGALDREIMEKYAPIVPLTYERNFSLIGSRVGGALLSSAYGATSLSSVYVK